VSDQPRWKGGLSEQVVCRNRQKPDQVKPHKRSKTF
jgi:hypothetical protein